MRGQRSDDRIDRVESKSESSMPESCMLMVTAARVQEERKVVQHVYEICSRA